MNTPRFKAVLFDLDGTLLDSYQLILDSMRYATREVLHKEFTDEVLMHRVGQPLEANFSAFSDDKDEVRVLVDTYRDYNERIHDEVIRAFDGITNLLQALKEAGVTMGVVTSKRTALAQQGLDVCDLSSYMDVLIGAYDCPTHKPSPEPVQYAYKQLGLQGGDCLYVGDSPYDIQAGNDAGCTTAAVLWGVFTQEQLLPQHPDYVCTTIDELQTLILS